MVEIESLGGPSYTQCHSNESEPTSSGPSSSSNRAESTDTQQLLKPQEVRKKSLMSYHPCNSWRF